MSAKMEKHGGYDYQFADKEKIPDECTCPICTLVQREAHQVICCGKIYCKSCLDEMKLRSYYFKCPNCRSSLRGEHKYFPDKNMNTKIRHFAIYCNNKDKGCQWKGHLKDFEEGHLPKCAYQIIGCSNECGVKLQRRKLDWHLKEVCPRRRFTCPFCKTNGEYKNITGDHITTCPDYILECPNTGCDKRIKRSQIAQHRNACPKEIVSCHHSSIGCNIMIKREQISSHDQECMPFHLHLAIKEIHELRAQCPLKIPIIKMQNYSRNKEEWISPGFYVSTGSYKMALKVSHGMDKLLRTDYLSCHLALLPGEYDNTLEWPFQGEVTVELLNQKEDKDHKKKIIYFNKDTPDKYKNRVVPPIVPPKVNGEWWGDKCFITETHLHPYLGDNDTLYFRVSVTINSKTKPWLV